MRGKLLTLTIFQPHFNQAKRFSNVYSDIGTIVTK